MKFSIFKERHFQLCHFPTSFFFFYAKKEIKISKVVPNFKVGRVTPKQVF